MKSNIAVNLKKLMNLANISESELSRRTNIKQPIIHRLLSGENTNPKLLTLKPLADYFMLSVSQLIGECDIEASWNGFTSKAHNDWTQVPLLNWERANYSKHENSKFVVTECAVSREAFAFYISDQSMEPLFPENCIAIIEPQLEPLHGNHIAIKSTNNKIILRNFLIVSQEKYINPINHKFGTITKLTDKDKILGTVIRTIYDHRVIEKDRS